MLDCRDRVVSRFERCRVQFADASDLWLAAESSVQLLGYAAGDVTPQAGESGIVSDTASGNLPSMRFSQLAERITSARESGLGTSTPHTVETSEKTETPEVILGRLERLKSHLTKYVQRFKPDELAAHHQCTCEIERW